MWLRTPDPAELLACLGTNVRSKQRVITIWYTTLLDAVSVVCNKCQCTGAMVVEDTVLLRPDVTYTQIAAEVAESGAPAGVWGYGDKWDKKENDGCTRI